MILNAPLKATQCSLPELVLAHVACLCCGHLAHFQTDSDRSVIGIVVNSSSVLKPL